MDFDPFTRGVFPVGVRSDRWQDDARDQRIISVEVYYPATALYQGQDLDQKTQDSFVLPGSMAGVEPRRQSAVRDAEALKGEFPVLIFSHGYSGDRREFAGVCAHAASHGYRVVSADHTYSTFIDVERAMSEPRFVRRQHVEPMATARRGDIPFLLDQAGRLFGAAAVAKAGITGVSMGGWTSLMAPEVDARVKAIVPMAPAGLDGPTEQGTDQSTFSSYRTLSWQWRSPVAVLMIVGDRDTVAPLYVHLDTFDRCPVDDKLMAVVPRADHQHFVDEMRSSHQWYKGWCLELERVDTDTAKPPWGALGELIRPFDELMPESAANELVWGLTVWHFDRVLKERPEAQALDLPALQTELRRRQLECYLMKPVSSIERS